MYIKRRSFVALLLALISSMLISASVFAGDSAEVVANKFYATAWALLPPIVAIGLALITKEVYSSLFIGIVVGALFNTNFNLEDAINKLLLGGVGASGKEDDLIGIVPSLSDSYNIGILIFLVILGAIVAMMNASGGSDAFGRWASTHIKSRVGAQISSVILGCLIFVDDYFNCLTVGSVMRPICDRHKVSRAKLSYIIDATAAPVCIIAPVSSWAAAVASYVPEGSDINGFTMFLKSIPYNYYALFTIVTMLCLIVFKINFGPMKIHEANAVLNGDIFTVKNALYEQTDKKKVNEKGKVIDLVFPIIVLIACCVLGMIYSGGFFSGTGLIDAFSNCDASAGLSLGSMIALFIIIIFFVARRVLTFKTCMDSIPEGFKAMVPAILILLFAWTLNGMTSALGAAEFVEGIMSGTSSEIQMFIPVLIFLVGCGLAFATGTSWGTFGMLIPIVISIFESTNPTMMVISISACMAGAVCGDHCSPISDTTIMASAGAECDHVTHVSTQLPYAILVAVISSVAYVFTGILENYFGLGIIVLPIGIVGIIVSTFWVNKKFVKEA